MHKSSLLLLVCAASALLAVGCASEHVEDLNQRLVSLERVSKKPPDATYETEPPDVLSVQVLNEEGTGTTAQIRQDGIITLPHLGETKVAGLTTAELRKKLEDMYTEFYKDPQVEVKVAEYRSKHIYVYGEIRSQGEQPYTGYQTLSDVIGAAGGVTSRADTNEVKIIRGDPDNPEVYWANLDKLIYEGDTKQDVSLAENDVVYVRPSMLAWIGYRIQEVLFPFRSVFSAASMYRRAEEISEGRSYYR